jgi:hypothetical protein
MPVNQPTRPDTDKSASKGMPVKATAFACVPAFHDFRCSVTCMDPKETGKNYDEVASWWLDQRRSRHTESLLLSVLFASSKLGDMRSMLAAGAKGDL